MAAVVRRKQSDIRIVGDFFALEWRKGNERVVSGMGDERRHCDVFDERQGACTFIIMRDVAEPHVWRSDEVVETSNRPDAAQPCLVITVGKQPRFAAQPVAQTVNELEM